jgi:hypothetical protein
MNFSLRLIGFLLVFNLLSFTGFGQEDPKNVKTYPRYNQTAQEIERDKNNCYTYADEQLDNSKHKTIKNTGAGAGAGAVVGKIFGKPGAGAVVGAAGGAYRGRKKSNKDKDEFNQVYASCLREKGYSVEVTE